MRVKDSEMMERKQEREKVENIRGKIRFEIE
jgi:hypothetical protein